MSNLSDLITATQETRTRFNDAAWWRGHAKAGWGLEAQVFRKNPEHPERRLYDETALIGRFVSRAPPRSHRPCPDFDDYFGWLFLAQHYGLPTRLLDWTENPLVAAYFAVQDSSDSDACIWALWPTRLNRVVNEANDLVQIRDPKIRKIAESAFTGNKSPKEVIIALDGQEIDPRMLAQMGKFTLHSDPTPLQQAPESVNSPAWLRQFVIPKDAKDSIYAQLSAFGIRHSNLFPDLASLATDLKSTFW